MTNLFKIRRILKLPLVLAFLALTSSCTKVSNKFNELSLACGEALPAHKYLRILSPDGEVSSDFHFSSQDKDFTGLKTSRACLRIPDHFEGNIELYKESGHLGLYIEKAPNDLFSSYSLKSLGSLPVDIWSSCGHFSSDYERDEIIIKASKVNGSTGPIVSARVWPSTDSKISASERGCFKVKDSHERLILESPGYGAIVDLNLMSAGSITETSLNKLDNDKLFASCGVQKQGNNQSVVRLLSFNGEYLDPKLLKLEMSSKGSSLLLPFTTTPLGCISFTNDSEITGAFTFKDEPLGEVFSLDKESPSLLEVKARPYYTPFQIWKTCGDGLGAISEGSQIFQLDNVKTARETFQATHIDPEGIRRNVSLSDLGCISRHRDEKGSIYIESQDKKQLSIIHLQDSASDNEITPIKTVSQKQFCKSGDIRFVESNEDTLINICGSELKGTFLSLCEITEGHGNNQSRFEELGKTVAAVKHSLNLGKGSCEAANEKLQESTSLNLSSYQISDLSPIFGLDHINALHLTDNQVVDISDVYSLKKLEYLFLAHNEIENIDGINSIEHLKILDLTDNKISNIADLRHLKKLSHLMIRYNPLDKFVVSDTLSHEINVISNDDFYRELQSPTTKLFWDNYPLQVLEIEEGEVSPSVTFEGLGPSDRDPRFSYLSHGFGTECYWDRPEHIDNYRRYKVIGRVDSPFRNLCSVLVAVVRTKSDFPAPQIILFKNKERRATKQSLPVWYDYPKIEQTFKIGDEVSLRIRAHDPKGYDLSYRFPSTRWHHGQCTWLKMEDDPSDPRYRILKGVVPKSDRTTCSRYGIAENDLTRHSSILPLKINIDLSELPKPD